MITVKKAFKHKNQQVYEIHMANETISCKFLSLGATLTHFSKANGDNIVVSYKNPKQYTNNEVYLGSTIGPLAGRTKDGKFNVDGVEYQLDLNDGANHLHGGKSGLHTHNFAYLYEDDEKFPSLVFTDTIDHSESGYPGSITYNISYRLVANTLIVNLKAFPDTKTAINLTTHAYFNLSEEDTILNHLLQIDSNQVVKLDDNYVPSQELIRVQNTAFDFRTGQTIGERIKKGHEQFNLTRSIDHPYLLGDKRSIVLFDSQSKQSLSINTTAPVCVIYLANFFDESFESERHQKAKNQAGIAIEPSDLPNGINLDDDLVYGPDKPFDQTTWYTLT